MLGAGAGRSLLAGHELGPRLVDHAERHVDPADLAVVDRDAVLTRRLQRALEQPPLGNGLPQPHAHPLTDRSLEVSGVPERTLQPGRRTLQLIATRHGIMDL